MKHPLSFMEGVHSAALQAVLRPDSQEVHSDPILAEVAFPLNGLDRLTLKVVECRNRPVFMMERQRSDRSQIDWRPINNFRVSFLHVPAIYDSMGRLLELARKG